MLQQTQVSRVLQMYPKFLRRFPTLRSLARASLREVVVAWSGMGYNNRAVRLHKLSRTVIARHRGRIPVEYDALIALPGVGKYTAHALLASAFGRPVPAIDVNARRFLSRVFWTMNTTAQLQGEKDIWRLASALIPSTQSYAWNQSIMDIGATICTARQPQCPKCPVRTLCASRTSMKGKVYRQPRREPSLDGIPNRIYRGRIIEVLRGARRPKSIRSDVLGRLVYDRFSPRNQRWLQNLLVALQNDGLVRVQGNGSLKAQLVSLA